jgi:sialidase-1
MLFAGADFAADAELKVLLGKKPFFEMWDEEMAYCSMVVAMDGTVLLFEPVRFDDKPGYTIVKRSEDGGKTWGPEIEVGRPVKIEEDMSDGGRYKGPQIGWTELGNTIVDENTGDIMVFATSLKAAQILYRSKDHGKTWKTEKIEIKPDINGWISNPNSACDPGITLRYGKNKGRLLVTSRVMWAYLNKSGGGDIFAKHYSNAIYSDDGGKTWIPSAPFPLGGTGEGGLVELSDSRIYYNSRTHMRGGNRRIAHSLDGGETWVDEHEDDELFDGPPDVYGCKAGLLRLPYKGRDILLFSSPGSRETRTDITVWVSFDGGETWPVNRLVRKGPGNYTWLAAGRKGTASEGMIYLAAGKDWMARFNLAWIMENQQRPEEKQAKQPASAIAEKTAFNIVKDGKMVGDNQVGKPWTQGDAADLLGEIYSVRRRKTEIVFDGSNPLLRPYCSSIHCSAMMA